jgi:hypothetical protein
VPECDREASIMRGPGPTMAVCATYINSKLFAHSSNLRVRMPTTDHLIHDTYIP